MKTNGNAETAGIEKPRQHNFLRLWGGLVQRTFPFMEEEVGELGPKARLFVTVCETVVKPETFKYAKWKGVGRPPAKRMPVFKAFLFKAVHDIPTTKELVERILLEPQTRRLCGWADPGEVPCESKFSEINKEFAEMGFTEEWFDEFVRPYAVDEPGGIQVRILDELELEPNLQVSHVSADRTLVLEEETVALESAPVFTEECEHECFLRL